MIDQFSLGLGFIVSAVVLAIFYIIFGWDGRLFDHPSGYLRVQVIKNLSPLEVRAILKEDLE